MCYDQYFMNMFIKQQLISNLSNPYLENTQQESELKKQNKDKEVDEIYEKYDKPIFVPTFHNKFKKSIDLEQSNEIILTNDFSQKPQQQPNQQNTTQDQKQALTQAINTEQPLNESKKEDYLDQILFLPQDSVLENQKFNQGSPMGKDVVSQFSSSQRLSFGQFMRRSNTSQFYNSQYRKNRQSEIKNQESNLILQKLQTIQDQNISNKIEDIIFNKKYFKKEKPNIDKQQNDQMMKRVEQQIKKELNILNFVKDILFLKKAILMILSQEQLAALQVISCSQQFLDLNLTEQFQSVKEIESSFSQNQQRLSIYDKLSKKENIQATKDNFSERFIYFQENSSLPINVPVFQNKKKYSLDIEQVIQSPQKTYENTNNFSPNSNYEFKLKKNVSPLNQNSLYKISENTNNSPNNSNFEIKVQKMFSPQNRNSLSSSSNFEKLNQHTKKGNKTLDFYLQKRDNKQQSIQNQQKSILNTIKSSNSNLQIKTRIEENYIKSIDFEQFKQKLQNIQNISASNQLKKIICSHTFCSKKKPDIIQQIKEQSLTHFEAQSILLENQKIQQHFMTKFLYRCGDENSYLSKVDKRIFKSFKKYNLN
ncbi:hypothetical protein ABPG73_001146 [Tetrahymena malaccensis]